MSADLIERLMAHVTALSHERVAAQEETDAPAPPTPLENDILAAVVALRQIQAHERDASLSIVELKRTQEIMHSAVGELQKYHEWAKYIRAALGAFPGGDQ
jgi:hypothetical protein